MGANLFYFIVVFLAFIFAVLAQPSGKSMVNKLWLGLSFFVLFFVLGFRNASGIDDPVYIMIFEEVNDLGVLNYWPTSFLEPGYLILNVIVGCFTDDFLYLQLITSFIPLLFFYKGFAKYSYFISIPYAVLLLCSLLYFQMLSTSLIRMFIAISLIFYYSIDHLLNKRTFKYMASIFIIAISFHYSAFLMLLFTPLAVSDETLQKYWLITATFLTAVVVAMLRVVMMFASVIGGRYEQYGEGTGEGFSIADLDMLPFFIFAIIYIKYIPPFFKGNYIRLLVILLFSIICSIGGQVLGRVIFYMNLALVLLLPCIYKVSKYNKIPIAIAIMVYTFLYIYVTQFRLEVKLPHLYPYQNIFFEIYK